MKRTILAICILIIAYQNSVCMEQNNNFVDFLTEKVNYDNLKIILEKRIKKHNDIEYSSISPNLQYEMLKFFIEYDDQKCLSLCLENKFNPNRYHKKPSLLHHAITHHNHKAITLLTQYNPDLTPVNDLKQTPLDYAISLGCKDCALAMSDAIHKKYIELVIHQKHCGLTKHILKPGYCTECAETLQWQLKYHRLFHPLFFRDVNL